MSYEGAVTCAAINMFGDPLKRACKACKQYRQVMKRVTRRANSLTAVWVCLACKVETKHAGYIQES